MVEQEAIYSPENFVMLLNCFDLIFPFLSKMKMKSKQTARGLPCKEILHPGSANYLGSIALFSSLLMFPEGRIERDYFSAFNYFFQQDL